MTKSLFLIIIFCSIHSNACLNLNGHLSGSCVYKSKNFGDLNGSIEFQIEQKSCKEMLLNGNQIAIPGELNQESKEGDTVQKVYLAISWFNTSEEILKFKYSMIAVQQGQKIDDVLLDGTFEKMGKGVLLKQTGWVDGDPVEVDCRLIKN